MSSLSTEPRIHVLLYTFNKADELGQTLASLRKTDYDNYKVFLLNNGSTDHTSKILDALPQKMFPGMEIINLPVNIGAPAARNWLLALPEHETCEYIAYFDDDIRVEPDWLKKMLAALKENPQAGVVGAKILNIGKPKTIQHSGGILTKSEDWIDNVAIWTSVTDNGQFDNVSERDYLMGCANLYRIDAIRDVGDFDLQFSPTQFDDVDHHLRMRLKGWKVLFHGGVEVLHTRKSGGPHNHNHIANRYKLQNKYTKRMAGQIISQGAVVDFLKKHPWAKEQNG
ncbi:glycosyltransferase family 2 protein [Desulfonatronovibrio magnus]|uniref:glycosyltransferase family 2 protein n=1 Tax=Desulfonatronovibrio magnus TaxID=698827 RepID=UPI0006973C03|nr:glycosyltransferase family 2 protein [Desulfonatronovibrio magnus]